MHFSGILDSLVVTEEYRAGSLRDGSIEDDDAYLGDEYESRDGYEDSSSNSDFQPKVRYTFTSLYIFLSTTVENRDQFHPPPLPRPPLPFYPPRTIESHAKSIVIIFLCYIYRVYRDNIALRVCLFS